MKINIREKMKLSIITINYNNLEGLKRTYDSVISQTCQDFEWIIIDGGSTDGSKEFIEEHQDSFAYWCSEPDKGVYNAMNKGIAKANGEYLNFMNSGDEYADERVIEEFIDTKWEEDVILGDAFFVGEFETEKIHPEEQDLDFDFIRNGGICHQAAFIKRVLFTHYGLYDESYKIIADWKFFIEVLMLHGQKYRHWDRKVARYDIYGLSSRLENQKLHIAERIRLYKEYERIYRSLEKRDKRIQELDLPVLMIFRRKILAKVNKLLKNK